MLLLILIRRPPKLGVLEFSCVSHIAYSHTHIITISYSHFLYLSYSHSLTLISCIYLILGGEFEGGDFRTHHQTGLNCALSSLCHTYYTILTYGICTMLVLHTQMPIWSYLELSGAIRSYLELSGAIWSYLELSEAIWSYLG